MKSVDIKIIFILMQNAFSQEELCTVGPHFKGAYFLDYFCNFAV